MTRGTVATRSLESIEKELEMRAPKNDPFAWYVFKHLPEDDRIDILERCQQTAVYVDRLGVLGAFELIFRASMFYALTREKPWVKHDLRQHANRIGARDEYISGGKKNGRTYATD